jgi:acyl-CoA thioester hydrolase
VQTTLRDDLSILFVVRDIQIRFKKPAKFDDAINVNTQLLKVGRSLLEFEQNIYRGDEHLIAAKVDVVCIGADSFKPVSIPNKMLGLLTL